MAQTTVTLESSSMGATTSNVAASSSMGSAITSLNVMPQDLSKSDKFDGNNFKRWNEKVEFLLTTLKVRFVLDTECPNAPIENPTPQQIAAKTNWDEANYTCRGNILNLLSDSLFDMYVPLKSARQIWKELERQYKTEDTGNKSYLVSNYFDFKMVDDKPILGQIHDLQLIVHQLLYEGISIDERFQVGAIIAKLPSSWNEYRKSLKRRGDTLKLDDLQRQVRIKEESRVRDKKNDSVEITKAAHVVEIDNKQQGKKSRFDKNFKGRSKPQFKKGTCHYCNKKGHYIRFCRLKKKDDQAKKDGQANSVEEHLVAVTSEVNLVANEDEWWVDTGATRHICGNRNLFKKYEKVGDEIDTWVILLLPKLLEKAMLN